MLSGSMRLRVEFLQFDRRKVQALGMLCCVRNPNQAMKQRWQHQCLVEDDIQSSRIDNDNDTLRKVQPPSVSGLTLQA